MSLLDNFAQLYETLDADAVSRLDQVYSGDVVFRDPVATHNGIVALKNYFKALLKNCSQCDFDIHSTLANENGAVVTWTMHFRHPKIKSGQTVSVEGISELRFDNERINYQRDYYDLGGMLYEHLPIVGPLIRWLKRRMAE